MSIRVRTRLVGLAAALLMTLALPAAPASADWSDEDQVQDVATEMFCMIRVSDAACYHGGAQTFTVGATGALTHVDLLLNRQAETVSDLVIEIHEGAPDGVLLATSEPVPPADIPVGNIDGALDTADWISFTLLTPVAVEAGDVLAIVIQPVPLDGPRAAWGWAAASTNVYGEGVRYGGTGSGGWDPYLNGSDMAFATWVALPVTRFAGADRYATAVAISESAQPKGVPIVYVATGLNFPDALAGAAAAGHDGAPLLLVPGSGSTIPAVVAGELDFLDPGKIVVLGGTGAVSAAIATKLHTYSANVVRYAGADRYATAIAISKATYPTAPVTTVFIATGLRFPDALAAAAVAGRDDAPLLLVPGSAPNLSGVPAVKAELTRLAPSRIVLVGGVGAISAGIAGELHTRFPAAVIVRHAGADRYATAAAISAANFAAAGHAVAYVATGLNFPDALAGAALAGYDEAPLLLVPGRSTDLAPYDVIENELTRLGPSQIAIFGGPGAVSPGLAADLAAFVVD